jgi:tetratricopeptide (TPR) repeat protein
VLRSLILFGCLLLAGVAVSQDNSVKDLIKSLDNKSATSKVSTIYQIGDSYIESDYSKAINWYQRGIDLAWGLDSSLLAVEGLVKRSKVELLIKEYIQAFNTSLNVLNYDVQLTDTIKSTLYINLGDVLFQLNALELALKYRNKLLILDSKKMSLSSRYYLTENIGFCHSRIGNLDSANYYYKLSMDLAESTLDTNLMLHCYNNLGYHYNQNTLFKNSIKYFDKGIELFKMYSNKKRRDSVIYAMILVNRSDCFMHESLLPLAKDEIYHSNKFLAGSDSSYYLGNISRLVSIYLLENNLDSCKKYLDLSTMFCGDDNFLQGHLERSIHYYRKIGNHQEERDANIRLIDLLKQKKNRRTNQLLIELIETQDEQVRKNLVKESQLKEDQDELEKNRMLLIISLLTLLMILSLMAFLIWRKKRRQINSQKLKLKEKEIDLSRMITEKLSEELENKNQDLTEFGIEISLKNQLVEDVLKMLKILDASDFNVEDVVKLIERHKQVDQSLSVFHENVEKINFEFMNKLALNYPNLTANDRQICAMLKLQLSSKEIGTLKNISNDSVKKLRYRLRKKMNLEPKTDLSNFFRDY